MKSLLEAGVHFGHQKRRWNPKMKQYIFAHRNGIQVSPPRDGGFASISSGYDHACGLRDDGTAVCWGEDVIDLQKTLRMLDTATDFMREMAAQGSQVLR